MQYKKHDVLHTAPPLMKILSLITGREEIKRTGASPKRQTLAESDSSGRTTPVNEEADSQTTPKKRDIKKSTSKVGRGTSRAGQMLNSVGLSYTSQFNWLQFNLKCVDIEEKTKNIFISIISKCIECLRSCLHCKEGVQILSERQDFITTLWWCMDLEYADYSRNTVNYSIHKKVLFILTVLSLYYMPARKRMSMSQKSGQPQINRDFFGKPVVLEACNECCEERRRRTAKENYENWLPSDSFIHLDDFKNSDEVAKYVKNVLDGGKERYLKYFDWLKRDPSLENYQFATKTDFSENYGWCKLCRLAKMKNKEDGVGIGSSASVK